MQDEPRRSQTFVSAFARGLAVIEAFDAARAPLGLSDVAARAGVDRAVARRMLLTLIKLGLVAETQKRYRLTPKVLRLGYSFLSQTGLDGIVQPFVAEVAQRTGESSSVSVLDETDVVSIAHAPSPVHKVGFAFRPGTRFPAHVMASGRVLLASKPDPELRALLARIRPNAFTPRTLVKVEAILAAVRQAGWKGFAFVDGELEEGMMSVAVPIRNRGGDVVASLNSSSSAARTSARNFRNAVVPVLQAASAEMMKILVVP
jgi:IclR family transcriptional regulator, pca regulon regulatory protein